MILTPTVSRARAVIFFIAAWAFAALTTFAQQTPTGLDETRTMQVYVIRLHGAETVCLDAAPYYTFEEYDRQLQRIELRHQAYADSAAVDSVLLAQAEAPMQPIVLPQEIHGERLKQLLDHEIQASTELVNLLRKQRQELDFYLNGHSKKDDGFKEVSAFSKKHKNYVQRAKDNVKLLQHLINLYDRGSALKATLEEHVLYEVENDATDCSYLRHDNLPIINGNGTPESRSYAFAMHRLTETDSQHAKSYVDRKGNVYRFITKKIHNKTAANFGERFGYDGSYYQGYFDEKNQRSGNGYCVDHTLVKCGEWEDDRYIGQVMNHHPGRIYGIDISRYNHDMKGPVRIKETIVTPEGKDSVVWRTTQKVKIGWDDLRITQLGPTSTKIDGEVNYPVEFVFIKCSEGMDLLSAYYNADLDSCLAHGIRVAPYHFYSSKSKAIDQAANFIAHARINEATMRPMLDVEPEPHQLKEMGGIDNCIKGMVTFVTEVEKATGRRCVLYLNQNFVERYYGLFPEELRKCDIWLAKYHEKHPWTKFHIWQFTPKGRVNGIYGDVDLNVFNGTRTAFERWCEAE